MPNDNASKALKGQRAQQALKDMLVFCQEELGYLTDIAENYRNGYPNYKNRTQFYLPFVIRFNDGTLWGISSTTTYRSDRIKMPQWDSYHLKRILGADVLTRSFLVYPDSVSGAELKNIQGGQKRFEPGYQVNGLDGIISQEELFKKIENYALKERSTASGTARMGNNFEKRVAHILKHPMNLDRLKGINEPSVGLFYPLFEKIMNALDTDTDQVEKVYATANKKEIGRLTSRGSPKTDVLVILTMKDGTEKTFTISCKRSRHSWVSVHEYKADRFADILDPENSELRTLLNRFQELGGINAFASDNPHNEEKLTRHLEEHLDRLIRWVMAGEGGTDDPRQTVSHILTYEDGTDRISIHDMDTYTDLLKRKKERYGTPFRWTKNNDNIQLKMQVTLEP